jgi:hypothetical protein
MIELKMTRDQIKATAGFQKQIELISFGDKRLAIVAQVFPDKKMIKCGLVSRESALKISDIIIKDKVQSQLRKAAGRK